MKHSSNDKYLVADIQLKNNRGTLNNCVVFKDDKKGQLNIQNKEIVTRMLNGELGNTIIIQNRYIHTEVYYEFIEKYEIKEIDGEDF